MTPVEGDKPSQLVLGPLGPSDERTYRKHVLHLEGLGIRDLRADGDDLLIGEHGVLADVFALPAA